MPFFTYSPPNYQRDDKPREPLLRMFAKRFTLLLVQNIRAIESNTENVLRE